MSIQEARRITIIDECIKGIRTNQQAAQLLNLTQRQVQRLKAKAREDGLSAVLHGNRGRSPSHAISKDQRQDISDIYTEELQGYNYTHARDVLEEDKQIRVSRSTVSRILKEQGIRSPKARRPRKNHPSRDPRPREGAMAQMDASFFDWLSNGAYLHLHGAIDDATGTILALHIEQEETTHGYNELVYKMNAKKHLPREFYVDCRTTFRNNNKPLETLTIEEELRGMTNFMTQFQRAMHELCIVLIYAHSPEAKGRIERLWETLQDRLPKDLARKGITTVEAANAYLPIFIAYFNRKFAIKAKESELDYLPPVPLAKLKVILAHQETRKLDRGLCFSYQGKRYALPQIAAGVKEPASHRDIVTVASSDYIGIQVLHKGRVLEPVELTERAKANIEDVPVKIKQEQDLLYKPKSKSPWYKTNSLLFAK